MLTKNYTKQQLSDSLYIERVFAMCSIVFAHLTFYAQFKRPMGIIGTMGVPIFLMLSGYLIKQEDANFSKLVPKLLRKIVVPWIILSTFTYLIHIIMGNTSFDTVDCIKWDLGYLTWMYYVPVYLICRIIGGVYCRINKKVIRYIFVAVVFGASLVSKYLTQCGIWGVTKWLTPYQNPINFICYYFIGVLVKEKNAWPVHSIKPSFVIITFITSCLSFVARILIPATSFILVLVKIAMNCSATTLLFCVSMFIVCRNPDNAICKGLIFVGKRTFLLFFIHMQLGVSVYNALISRLSLQPITLNLLTVFAPIPILCILSALVWCVDILATKLGLGKYAWIVGL